MHDGKCGSDECREGALAVKWYDQSYESGGRGGSQVVRVTRVVQVHLISDIILLYVINYTLKFLYLLLRFVCNACLPTPTLKPAFVVCS